MTIITRKSARRMAASSAMKYKTMKLVLKKLKVGEEFYIKLENNKNDQVSDVTNFHITDLCYNSEAGYSYIDNVGAIKAEIKTETYEDIEIFDEENGSILNTTENVLLSVSNSISLPVASMESKLTIKKERSIRSLNSHSSVHIDQQLESTSETFNNCIGNHNALYSEPLENSRHYMDDSIFACALCPYRTFVKKSLRSHISSVHNRKKRFSCRNCKYKATQKSHLKDHITATHNKEKPFNCEYCSFKSSWRTCLMKHIGSVHNKNKPYNCEHCSYKASSKSNLKTHIRSVHNKEKPYTCERCSYKTSRRGNLNEHIRSIHNKERPYTCRNCPYKTGYKSSLNKHIRSVHKKTTKLKRYIESV